MQKCLPIVVTGVLVAHAALLTWGAYRHSPTIDESRWLPAGLAHWDGDFSAGRVNPPLVRLVAAAPVMLAVMGNEQQETNSTSARTKFAEDDGACWLFTMGRWACIPFSLVGGYVCYCWGRDLYGTASGMIALMLWCFSPNILAHAQIVAHDAPAASLGIAAAYLFWKWLRQPTWERAILAGVVLGVAQLMKTTLVILFGLWPALWLVWYSTGSSQTGDRGGRRQSVQLLLLLALGLNVLNLGYGFDGSFRKLKNYTFVSQTLSGVDGQDGNRFARSWLGSLPVPLPAEYLLGIDQQKRDLEGGSVYAQTYLRGQWHDRGLWYFYLYALLIKVPLGSWGLLLLSAAVRAFHLDDLKRARDEVLLVIPGLSVLVLASSQTGFTDHLRYVLPIFPFVFVWISRVGCAFVQGSRAFRLSATVALGWSIGSSLWIYPHSLSYFNELVGGPRNGDYHLVSSNIDYGQDLLYLKAWLDKHPEARPFHLAYWNQETVDPAILGIGYSTPPSGPAPELKPPYSEPEKLGPHPGWHAANVNVVRGDHWPGRTQFPDFGYYGYLLNFEPVATAGYSIYVYNINVEEANRVRRRMNLPPISND